MPDTQSQPSNVYSFPPVTVTPAQEPSNIPLMLLPITPVPFQPQTALWAYLRLGIYGTAAILTYEKMRKISYVFMGAAGLSLLTSLAGGLVMKQQTQKVA